MSSEIESVNTAELMERVEMEQAEMEQVEMEPGLEPELDPELDLSDNDTSDLLDEKLVIMGDRGGCLSCRGDMLQMFSNRIRVLQSLLLFIGGGNGCCWRDGGSGFVLGQI